jgi:hypothetical protein
MTHRRRACPARSTIAAVSGAVLLGALGASAASASECDEFYAWRHAVPDSTTSFNERVNEIVSDLLEDINAGARRRRMSCDDVAKAITSPLVKAGTWDFFGAVGDWGLVYVPASNTELKERYGPVGIYRGAFLFPLGLVAPINPIVKLDGVLVGTDKLGHFFAEGRRYARVYDAAVAAGASPLEAERAAIDYGVRWERGVYGGVASGIFSYADLESNWQGFRYWRTLCDEGDPALVQDDDGAWALRQAFAIEDWVNPCWSEAFNPNGLAKRHHRAVTSALREVCPVFYRPEVQRLWSSYAERGCHSRSQRYLMQRLDDGELLDPTPTSILEICPLE